MTRFFITRNSKSALHEGIAALLAFAACAPPGLKGRASYRETFGEWPRRSSAINRTLLTTEFGKRKISGACSKGAVAMPGEGIVGMNGKYSRPFAAHAARA